MKDAVRLTSAWLRATALSHSSAFHGRIPRLHRGSSAAGSNDSRIGLEELQSKLAAGDIVLLDALSTEEYRSGHVPGALNLPPRRARRLAPLYVPDKSAEIVVYGANVESEAGRQLARRLRQLGYANVRLFAGGKHEWIRFLLPAVASVRGSAADQPTAHRDDSRVDIAA